MEYKNIKDKGPIKLSINHGVWVIRDSHSNILIKAATLSQNLTYGQSKKWKFYDEEKKTWKNDLVLTVTSLSETQALEDDEILDLFDRRKAVPLLYYDNRFLACFQTGKDMACHMSNKF